MNKNRSAQSQAQKKQTAQETTRAIMGKPAPKPETTRPAQKPEETGKSDTRTTENMNRETARNMSPTASNEK